MIDPSDIGYKEKETKRGLVEFDRHINKPSYNNLRTQCAFKLASKIKAGKLSIRVNPSQIHPTKADSGSLLKDVIEAELSVLKDKNFSKIEQKRQLISKDIMKEILNYSPDLLDTLIMRGVFDLIDTYDIISERKITPLKERKFFKARNKKRVTYS